MDAQTPRWHAGLYLHMLVDIESGLHPDACTARHYRTLHIMPLYSKVGFLDTNRKDADLDL